SSTKSQQAATRNRGKAIVNSPQPIYDQEHSMVAEDDETSKDKEIDKLMALISLSHVARECQKPKRVKDAAYHREKTLLCKQEEAGIQLNIEQADWRDDTDDELEDQELKAHYMYMAQLQEVSPDAAASGPIFDTKPVQKVSTDDHYNVFAIESKHSEQSESVHDTYPIKQDEHNVIIDSLDMSYDREQIDQNNDDNDLTNERELLASLIEKLKCEIDDIKNRNKCLETSNKVLIKNLKGEIEDFKNKNKSLESSNNRFKEANNKLSETNNLLYTDFKKSQAELARRNDVKYASKVEIDYAKARGDLISYKIESQKSFNKYTQTINDLNHIISEMKEKLCAHQETIYILSQQKEAQIKLYKTREDKVIALENKVKVLDNIVYKTDTLTPELLAGPTYKLLKGSCKSLVELEFFLEEVYKDTTDQLDWNNPKGKQYPHNLLKPLPLIPNSRGRRIIPFDHFIKNDLEYLRGGASSRKYTTSVTKTKTADYGHIKEFARDVYSKRRIIVVTELQIVERHNYKHLDWITVRRDDDKLYKFKEGDFKKLRIQDIEDMLLLLVQGKLTNLTVEERFAFNVSLR
nr:hypothetical protein [Tanacetum cinerariifolium]